MLAAVVRHQPEPELRRAPLHGYGIIKEVSSITQGKVTLRTGSLYGTIDRLARYDEAPPFELIIHSWDLAATKGGGDFTVCAKFGLAKDPGGRDILYLIGVVLMRVELPDVRAQIAAHDEAEKPALIIMDGIGIGLGPYQELIRQGLKHILPSGTMQRENIGHLKTIPFWQTITGSSLGCTPRRSINCRPSAVSTASSMASC